MYGVDAIQYRNAGGLLCSCGLNARDEFMPLGRPVSVPCTVEYAAHLEVDQGFVHQGRVQAVRLQRCLALWFFRR